MSLDSKVNKQKRHQGTTTQRHRGEISGTFPQCLCAAVFPPCHDVSRDEYVVAIDNRGVYYSDEYQKLVMDLEISSLWPAGVDNYFFVVENKPRRVRAHASLHT
jgi:hypothetical protein